MRYLDGAGRFIPQPVVSAYDSFSPLAGRRGDEGALPPGSESRRSPLTLASLDLSPRPKSDVSDFGHLSIAELGNTRVRCGEVKKQIRFRIAPASPSMDEIRGRVFVEWELFLEETFVRYLCGYQSNHGPCQLLGGQAFRNLGLAEAAMLHGRPFALWHDPSKVIARSQQFFNNGFHETVIASNSARLEHFSAVRHRIVHGQLDARQKFDIATMNLVGRRYLAARPGRFLRDWDHTVNPPRRWLETLGAELALLASQIA